MTFEQLAIFVAVAEREHVTRAAEVLHLTPSAVSAAIRALEAGHAVRLFDRVGRRIVLTEAGRLFLGEARATLARLRAATALLDDLGGMKRGTVRIHASQTIANHWLPERLMAFRRAHPPIGLELAIGNTAEVARAVREGEADLGFVEGAVDDDTLAAKRIGGDRLVIVVAPGHPCAADPPATLPTLVAATPFVMREKGSGTRAAFEAALFAAGVDPAGLDVLLELAANEAVLAALTAGGTAAAVSGLVARPHLAAGDLVALPLALPERAFLALRHRERRPGVAAAAFAALCGA